MQSASHVDTSIEDADQWELARNPTYVRMQKTLIERTVERDRLRCVCRIHPAAIQSSNAFAKGPHTWNLFGLLGLKCLMRFPTGSTFASSSLKNRRSITSLTIFDLVKKCTSRSIKAFFILPVSHFSCCFYSIFCITITNAIYISTWLSSWMLNDTIKPLQKFLLLVHGTVRET